MGSPETGIEQILLGDRVLTDEGWVDFLEHALRELDPLLAAFTMETVGGTVGWRGDQDRYTQLKTQGYFKLETTTEVSPPLGTLVKSIWGLTRNGNWLVAEIAIALGFGVVQVRKFEEIDTAAICRLQGPDQVWMLLEMMVRDCRRSIQRRNHSLQDAEEMLTRFAWFVVYQVGLRTKSAQS